MRTPGLGERRFSSTSGVLPIACDDVAVPAPAGPVVEAGLEIASESVVALGGLARPRACGEAWPRRARHPRRQEILRLACLAERRRPNVISTSTSARANRARPSRAGRDDLGRATSCAGAARRTRRPPMRAAVSPARSSSRSALPMSEGPSPAGWPQRSIDLLQLVDVAEQRNGRAVRPAARSPPRALLEGVAIRQAGDRSVRAIGGRRRAASLRKHADDRPRADREADHRQPAADGDRAGSIATARLRGARDEGGLERDDAARQEVGRERYPQEVDLVAARRAPSRSPPAGRGRGSCRTPSTATLAADRQHRRSAPAAITTRVRPPSLASAW